MLTEVGIFLRKLRLDKNEILKDMAEKLGVSSSFLSAVENGKKKMPQNWTQEIPKIYDFDQAQVFEFNKAVAKTNEMIEINLEKLNDKQTEFAFSFARRLEELDDDVIDSVKKFFEDQERSK